MMSLKNTENFGISITPFWSVFDTLTRNLKWKELEFDGKLLFFLEASCSLGAAHKSIELSLDYVKSRKQFGRKLSEFQVQITTTKWDKVFKNG